MGPPGGRPASPFPDFALRHSRPRRHGSNRRRVFDRNVGPGYSRPCRHFGDFAIRLLRLVAWRSHRTVGRGSRTRAGHASCAGQHVAPVRTAHELGNKNCGSAQRRNAGGRRHGHAAVLLTGYAGEAKSICRFDALSFLGHGSGWIPGMLRGPPRCESRRYPQAD